MTDGDVGAVIDASELIIENMLWSRVKLTWRFRGGRTFR